VFHGAFPWAARRVSRLARLRQPSGCVRHGVTRLSVHPHRCGVGRLSDPPGEHPPAFHANTLATPIRGVTGPIVPRRWWRAWAFLVQTHGKSRRRGRRRRQGRAWTRGRRTPGLPSAPPGLGHGVDGRDDLRVCSVEVVHDPLSGTPGHAPSRSTPTLCASTPACPRAEGPVVLTPGTRNWWPSAPRFGALGAKPGALRACTARRVACSPARRAPADLP
jgi:hypothetical protein